MKRNLSFAKPTVLLVFLVCLLSGCTFNKPLTNVSSGVADEVCVIIDHSKFCATNRY